jgi:hypothetical protein
MSDSYRVTAPVLFLVFNRPETTKRVFDEIKKAKPTKLYVAADGPRNHTEKIKTDIVKKLILDNIDWKCKVKTILREKNLGCKEAVSSAISWFFKNEESGIILEDDCLPSPSFFRFCQELLERYKDDERIMQISGTNVVGKSDTLKSYFFSKRISPWGWATWRRAWALYDKNLDRYEALRKSGEINEIDDPVFRGFLGWRTYRMLRSGKLDTWDFQWVVSCIHNNGLGIIPKNNLITNIGFIMGTHTTNFNKNKAIPRFNMDFPLRHNETIINNKKYYKQFAEFFGKGWFLRRVVGIIDKMVKILRRVTNGDKPL